MKKKEILFLGVIAAIALVIVLMIKFNASDEVKGVEVTVYHGSDTVLVFDSGEDATYTIEGDYGTLDIVVEDGRWCVTNEDCPNHICSQMGWVGEDEYMPITCIPNDVVVIQKSDS